MIRSIGATSFNTVLRGTGNSANYEINYRNSNLPLQRNNNSTSFKGNTLDSFVCAIRNAGLAAGALAAGFGAFLRYGLSKGDIYPGRFSTYSQSYDNIANWAAKNPQTLMIGGGIALAVGLLAAVIDHYRNKDCI